MQEGLVSFSGTLEARVIKGNRRVSFLWKLLNVLRLSFLFGLFANKGAKLFSSSTGIPTLTAELSAVKIDGETGQRTDYGVIGYRVVTTAFVNFLVDMFQADTTEVGDLKYHDSGVGTTAENIADTAMETTDGESRVAGTQIEGATANIYKSVATISYTSTKAITEHGVFSQVTGGTLIDRTVFAALNVISGDSIQFTYQLTLNTGG